ncbi:MAG: efflux RND transporter periplasmic adaptor subunit [Planctomycetaceae bacterium]
MSLVFVAVKAVDAADDALLPVTVSPVTVMLIEQREISFRDPGLLDSMNVTEGMNVTQGQTLAGLDASREEIAVETARVNLQAAELQLNNQLPVETARAWLAEVRAALQPLQAALLISQKGAESRTLIEMAETDRDTSQVELERAQRARARFESAVSASEILRLETLARKGLLSVDKANTDHDMAQLQPRVHEAEIEAQNSTIARHELLVQQELKNLDLLQLTVAARRTELQQAELALARRRMIAPMDGVVAEVIRKPGEWVEPGATVVRVIQLSRLRVEGNIDVSLVLQDLQDRVVTITFPDELQSLGEIRGRITHVSPEVQLLEQQLRVWAEFENTGLKIRPGMSGAMTIHAEKAESDVVPSQAENTAQRSGRQQK